jgi:flagellar hook-basal body complex protein FliE
MTLQELATELGVKESKALELLAEADLSIEEVRVHHVGALKRALTPAPLATTTDRASTGNRAAKPIAPVKGATTSALATNTAAPLGNPIAQSAGQVRDRRAAATTNVLANASNQVSSILEEAAIKAEEMLQGKKSATVDRLANQMVASAEAEIDSAMGFFDQFMLQTGQSAIDNFQGMTVDVTA